MTRGTQAPGTSSRVYTPVLLAIFRKKLKEQGAAESIGFTLDDIRAELEALGLKARNAPDVIYRMKSRTALPEEIQSLGYKLLSIKSRGRYAFEKADTTLIAYPVLEPVDTLDEQTPIEVRALLYEQGKLGGIDEQGLLSVLRYNDMFSRFLGVETVHIKSHVRRSVPGVGQVEVDDVYYALGEPRAIVPVEAKAKDDPVNRVQIAMQVRYALHAFAGIRVRPLTVKIFEDGTILFMEFDPTVEAAKLTITQHRAFRLTDHR